MKEIAEIRVHGILNNLFSVKGNFIVNTPITVSVRSKNFNVFTRSKIRIVRSNPTDVMDIRLRLCEGNSLVTD
jgi:hypothetical protein